MKIRIKWFDLISYIFFFLYFVSYVGEKTSIKYAAILLFQMYLLLNIKKTDIFRHDKGYSTLFICIFVVLMISLSANFNISGAIKTLSLIDLSILVYFMLSKGIERFDVDEKHIITIITNSLFFALLIAFLFFYNDTMTALGRQSHTTTRHVFGLGAPSVVGFLCFVEFLLSFYLFTERKKRVGNLFLYIKIMLSLGMMILADIRSPMVAIAIFLIVYIFYKLPQNRSMIILEILLCTIIFAAGLFFLTNTTINMNTLNFIFSQRFVFFRRAINEVVADKAVLFGVGSFRNSEVAVLSRVQIDNSFLDIFYQYGIIAAILFMWLSIKICVDLHQIGINTHKHEAHQYRYMQFINAYVVSLLSYSMVEKNLFSISSALSLVSFLLIFWYISKNKPIKKNMHYTKRNT